MKETWVLLVGLGGRGVVNISRSTDYHAAFAPGPTTEGKKLVFSKNIFRLLTWHLSAIISCLVTGVILDQRETRNILAALQLAAKTHEILIIVSLGRIARQWIQQCLIKDGLLLGLIGAESSLSNLTLLVSRGFRATISYTITILRNQAKGRYTQAERRRAKALILLLGSLSIGCLLCSLAGPSSAVLIIPSYDWFHEVDIFNGYEYYTNADDPEMVDVFEAIEGDAGYPNISIAPELLKSNATGKWGRSRGLPVFGETALPLLKPKTRVSLDCYLGLVNFRINADTSLNRELVTDASWRGTTNLTSAMFMDTSRSAIKISGYEPAPKSRGSGVKYVTEVTGVEVNTVCRRQQKESCSRVNGSIENSLEWCFTSVIENSPSGLMLSSNDLLLVYGASNSSKVRVWFTGGRIASKDKFADSIVVVIEVLRTTSFDPSLIVCSLSATLKSVTASSTTQLFTIDELDFHEYISYSDRNSTTNDSPRKLLYHHSWLESAPGEGSKMSDPCHYTPNKTYPCYGKIEETQSVFMRNWGTAIVSVGGGGYNGIVPWWRQSERTIGAETPETIVGGSFLSVLLFMLPSSSQYNSLSKTGVPAVPKELMVEPIRDYTQYLAPPVKVYRLIYGFKLSSRISILSVVVLLLHVVLVFVGSFWQFRRGILIQSWGSIPEYVTLCLGSDAARGVENSCAGIGQDETLNKIVRTREVTDAHLELVVLSPDTKLLGFVVDPEKKYGFLGVERRQIKQEVE